MEIYYLEDIERTGDEFLRGFPFVLPFVFLSIDASDSSGRIRKVSCGDLLFGRYRKNR